MMLRAGNAGEPGDPAAAFGSAGGIEPRRSPHFTQAAAESSLDSKQRWQTHRFMAGSLRSGMLDARTDDSQGRA